MKLSRASWLISDKEAINLRDMGLIPGPGRCHMFGAPKRVCYNY